MTFPLEDEFGDIVQKARDRRPWSQAELARETGLSSSVVMRIENCDLIPDAVDIAKIAKALDLHEPSLQAIANGKWEPEKQPELCGDFEVVCLQVFMGSYPVKCYLLICKKTRMTAIVDTGGNPKEIINAAKQWGVTPGMVLLTHTHPDHAGGLNVLLKQWPLKVYVGKKEPRSGMSGSPHYVEDGEKIQLGALTVEAIQTPGHTPGGVSYRLGSVVFSGDCIFAGSMGRANTSWSALYQSVSQRLLAFPNETRLLPGHGPATTVGEEKLHNPFFFYKK
ncbi:MAG: hydrolase [Nitrospinae bacterium CG11_big_fil_rev_8_21_14_0_20_45_15]|nr:MAG: hydrolase [Nitrospinae bacterium CG11_big_fil_rev_8_21_14_0_20_45_15]